MIFMVGASHEVGPIFRIEQLSPSLPTTDVHVHSSKKLQRLVSSSVIIPYQQDLRKSKDHKLILNLLYSIHHNTYHSPSFQ